MHDWTLLSAHLDWDRATLEMKVLDNSSAERSLLFEMIREFSVERAQPWGPSESINEVSLLHVFEEGSFTVRIEMQSGDGIHVTAGSCKLDKVPFQFQGALPQ